MFVVVDVWNFWKNKMMVHPKMAKDVLDAMYRVCYSVAFYVEITLGDL